MPNNDTLLAYLVPRLTSQVENAATEALGYILNGSTGSMQALNDLLREGGLEIEPIARVETQVTYEDGSRPDMAGYDENSVKRLLVDSEILGCASEGTGKRVRSAIRTSGAGGTAVHLSRDEVRIPTLWTEVQRQMKMEYGLELMDPIPGVRGAKVVGAGSQVALVSWARLLDKMNSMTGDDNVRSDKQQLRGLAQMQDEQAFLPIHSEELNPSLGRRVVGYNRLVDNVVDARGIPEKWMDVKGLRATPQRYGYGRYFHFSSVRGDFWFGVNHQLWAENGDTPLWLSIGFYGIKGVNDAVGRALNVKVQGKWGPIFPELGVEYHKVLDDVVAQLKTIAELLRSIPIGVRISNSGTT